jgi:hypothetical protein
LLPQSSPQTMKYRRIPQQGPHAARTTAGRPKSASYSAMRDDLQRVRLETEAIVVGYAMSRLDMAYLQAQHCRTWKEAFEQAAAELDIRPASLKNLRDEFDPVHNNTVLSTSLCTILLVMAAVVYCRNGRKSPAHATRLSNRSASLRKPSSSGPSANTARISARSISRCNVRRLSA